MALDINDTTREGFINRMREIYEEHQGRPVTSDELSMIWAKFGGYYHGELPDDILHAFALTRAEGHETAGQLDYAEEYRAKALMYERKAAVKRRWWKR